MFTHTITRKWASAGASISKSEAVTADGEQNLDVTAPANATAHPVAYAIAVALLQSFYMVCTVDATITPYDTSAVAMDPIELQAGVPYVWTIGSGLDNPFADDIGSLKIGGVGASDGVLSVRSLYDSTSGNPVGS